MEAVLGPVDIETFHQLIGREQGDITWWQMTIRAILVFLYGLVLVRLAGQRVFAKLSGFDILVAILVGSNLSRTLTANTPFIPTLVATSSIVFVYWIITYLAFHSKFVGWLVKGDLVRLMRDGQVDWKAMSRHGISEGDVEEAARRKGVHRFDEVEAAFLERGGDISILRRR